MVSEDADESGIRGEVSMGYALIGATMLVMAIPSPYMIYVVWLVGLVFTGILLHRRKHLTEAQRNLMYTAVVIYILGTIFYETSLASILSEQVGHLARAINGGNISTSAFAAALQSFVPVVVGGTIVLHGGLTYMLLGLGMLKRKLKPLFVFAVSAGTAMIVSSQILAFRAIESDIRSLGSTVSIYTLGQEMRSATTLSSVRSPLILLLSIAGSVSIAAFFVYISWKIRANSIPLVFHSNEGRGYVPDDLSEEL